MTLLWPVLGGSDRWMLSLPRLMRDLEFLLAPSEFTVYAKSTVNTGQKGDMMAEKTRKEKTKKDGPAPGLATGGIAKNRKEKTPKPETPKQRTAGKAEDNTPRTRLIAFYFRAPWASDVFLAGCFNGWDPHATPLHRQEDGTWTCSISIQPGEHEYRFLVDGQWQDDPLNADRRRNAFGTENCLLVVDQ